MADDVENRVRAGGLLYPMLVIAALTLTVFIGAGIATMLGWMPDALAGQEMSRAEAVRSIEAPAGSGGAEAGGRSGNQPG